MELIDSYILLEVRISNDTFKCLFHVVLLSFNT